MAKLYFYYSAMNAGKTTTLLQSAYNYKERGMDTILLTTHLDDRSAVGNIASRIGLEQQAWLYKEHDNLWDKLSDALKTRVKVKCILIDEAQFLTETQVWELARIVDECHVPVLCYGLRTDFVGDLFPGSAALLAISDVLTEIKTICLCGKKASMNLRLDSDKNPVITGDQIAIGGNESYEAMCRSCFCKIRRSSISETSS